jgi:hypothetical protein
MACAIVVALNFWVFRAPNIDKGGVSKKHEVFKSPSLGPTIVTLVGSGGSPVLMPPPPHVQNFGKLWNQIWNPHPSGTGIFNFLIYLIN